MAHNGLHFTSSWGELYLSPTEENLKWWNKQKELYISQSCST